MNIDYKDLLEKKLISLEGGLEESSHGLLFKHINQNKKVAQFWHKIEKPKRHRINDKIEALKAALKRLDEGTYGKCSSCGKELTQQELLIAPESDVCRSCIKRENKNGKEFKRY